MRNFILKTIGISILMLGFIWLSFWQADGRTDPFYLRLTTPEQHSLILGTSRAAQGIIPTTIDSVLGRTGSFNFAMTVSNTPFGPAYLRNISKKLDKDSRDGLFIIEVSPWSLSSVCEDPNDTASFREANKTISNISNINIKPNIEYLMHAYSNPFYELWFPKHSGMILRDDGWLEVSISMDQEKVESRTSRKMVLYEGHATNYQFASTRFEYLKKTIEFLKKYGKVYIVRLPTSDGMLAIESKFMPDFNDLMLNTSKEKEIPYYDLTNTNMPYAFTDGNHLWKKSSEKVSIEIARLIRSN